MVLEASPRKDLGGDWGGKTEISSKHEEASGKKLQGGNFPTQGDRYLQGRYLLQMQLLKYKEPPVMEKDDADRPQKKSRKEGRGRRTPLHHLKETSSPVKEAFEQKACTL